MSAIEHIKANLIGYLLPIVAMLMWAGFTAFMDQRHDRIGEAKQAKTEITQSMMKTELRALKREKRKLEGYQRLAPNSEYSASRAQEIHALTDEIAEIELELK